MRRFSLLAVSGLLLLAPVMATVVFCTPAAARQDNGQAGSNCMPGMAMPGCPGTTDQKAGDHQEQSGLMNMHPETFLQEIVSHGTSGTGAEPNSTPVPMLMKTKGSWMLMFHANVFVAGTAETSSRGSDKVFSTNWIMGMAQRKAGPGVFTARAMLSLEPATISDRQYPLLFQQGETAYGKPIADGQHPHDFFMELAVLYDLKVSEHTLLSFYFAPVGEPAIGPTAYPHRASDAENPVAALGHHQEDSTHVSDDVVTAGVAYRVVRLEASGFHGREPGEDRWSIDQGALDSWSVRLTIQPGKNWSGQYSYGRLNSPEALFPLENQERMTASVMYNRPFAHGNWASTILWGQTRSLPADAIEDSHLLESTLRFRTRNYVWTRIEDAERTNLLLLGENLLPPGFGESPIGRVQAYTFGYDHDFDLIPHLASAIGAQFSAYGVPSTLQSIYGVHPVGGMIFIRLRPFSRTDRE